MLQRWVLVRWRSLRFAPVDLFYSIVLWIRLPLARYAIDSTVNRQIHLHLNLPVE
jgi:hypothetical protein